MPRLTPVSRRELIRRLIELGFDGPYAGGRHEFLVRDDVCLILPNPHRDDIGVGLTLHFMDPGVDTGPLLLQRRVGLRPGDTIASLRRRMEPQMVELMLEGLRGLGDGSVTPRPQLAADGRQYFVMHPRIKTCAERRLSEIAQEK